MVGLDTEKRMLKNICEGYLEQKTKKMIEEMLARRYMGIVEENNMCFREYKQRCFDEAEKVITQETKRDDKKNNINRTK